MTLLHITGSVLAVLPIVVMMVLLFFLVHSIGCKVCSRTLLEKDIINYFEERVENQPPYKEHGFIICAQRYLFYVVSEHTVVEEAEFDLVLETLLHKDTRFSLVAGSIQKQSAVIRYNYK